MPQVMLLPPSSKMLLGYAVFEGNNMISPIFYTYMDVFQWMKRELKHRNEPTQSYGMSM
jgi:hypothetical protein